MNTSSRIFLGTLLSAVAMCFVALFQSCATQKTSAPPPADNRDRSARSAEAEPAAVGAAARNQGYGLLHELVSKQKDVSKILIIKKEKSDLHAVIKEISAVSHEATKRLEAFAAQDKSITLKSKGLPWVEEKTRASIESARTKQLLGSSKRKFELELLLTQSEALTYGTHLAKSLAQIETEPQRRDYLTQLSGQLDGLYVKVLNLITSRYTQEF